MRLYDVEQSAQGDILDGPVFDNTDFGERVEDEVKIKKGKKDFTGLKV